MKNTFINNEDRQILLELARRSVELAARKRGLPNIKMGDYSRQLQQYGASFVTLTVEGKLRGCIGTLEPYQPLVLDVIDHAAAAAIRDSRFPPVTSSEVQTIAIEISVLSPVQDLIYSTTQELLDKLIPGEDGVILRNGQQRATFLPQVWEQIPEKEEFLSHLCLKMGAEPSLWKTKLLDVQVYRVEEFHD